MKTKELVKKIRDLGYKVEEDEYEIKSYGDVGLSYTIFKKYMGLVMEDTLLVSSKGVEELKSIIEYLETPLEEREEEKKYYLRLPDWANDDCYLNFIVESDSYLFCDNCDSLSFKTLFTQTEISNIPFNTDWLIKEEVK